MAYSMRHQEEFRQLNSIKYAEMAATFNRPTNRTRAFSLSLYLSGCIHIQPNKKPLRSMDVMPIHYSFFNFEKVTLFKYPIKPGDRFSIHILKFCLNLKLRCKRYGGNLFKKKLLVRYTNVEYIHLFNKL